jgi:alpha-L-rhamnosidase
MKGTRSTLRSICWIFAASAAPLHLAAVQPAAAQPGVVLEEFVFLSSPNFRSCHAATVLESPTGGLLTAFFGGTAESHPDVEIRLSRKPAGGSWTAPESVADGAEPGVQRMSTGNPVLFQPKGGDVMLFYKVIRPKVGFVGRVKRSSDGGRTWGAASEVGDGLMGAVKNKPIQIAGGAILSPSSTEDRHGWRVHIERSTDGGKSWKLIGPINPDARIGAIQPALLTYADGRIQMLCRTRSEHERMAQCWSGDGGLTWSPLEMATLPNNNSGFDAVTLRDGRQLMVYNHSTREQPGMGHKGRGILNVALSRDGINWEASLILDYIDQPGKQFSYPSVIQASDGLVHLVYTWHRQRIKHVVLDPTLLKTTPMPNGEWPATGPFSLKAAQARWRAQQGLK